MIQAAFLVALVAGPLLSKKVEHNIELYFLALAAAGATIGDIWSLHLLEEALLHPVAVYQPGIGYIPVGITQVVLLAGLAFYTLRRRLAGWADKLAQPAAIAVLIAVMGFSSSAVSAIVASAIMAELLAFAKAPHAYKAKAAVYAAYAIGVGAALLPIGEPLSTIAIAKLKTHFFYLVDVLVDAVALVVIFFAAYAYVQLRRYKPAEAEIVPYEPELKEVVLRAVKIFVFIFALTILGEFFKPLANAAATLGKELLYIFGAISAVADNATLVAALVSSEMAAEVLRAFILSIVISGGFTVPGNVPNIVFASVLKIGFKEWLRLALPIGVAVFAAMGAYVLFIAPHPPLA